jgi:phosphoglycolate phosphatase-like HAD superfamily hydrolase
MLFQPKHTFLIGIDSDGCVFDSMEVKQIQHFHPLIVKHWDLRRIEMQVRAVAEYVNLRSPWRGSDRFRALLKTFEFLHQWDACTQSGVKLPEYRDLAQWVQDSAAVSNDSLAVAAKNSPELQKVLEWSLDVNQDIATRMMPVPVFDGAADALTLMHAQADTVVISLTPLEALEHEWDTHGIRSDVDAILGQEWGSKQEQIRLAMSQSDYPPERVMMIGDAPGDLASARASGVSYYPIIPGRESESWKRLLFEDLDAFLRGEYKAEREAERIAEFEESLNGIPPWEA